MAAVAAMEHAGIPLDLPMLQRLRDRWSGLKADLIEEIDRDFGVFENTHLQGQPIRVMAGA